MVEIRGIISRHLNRGINQVINLYKTPKQHNFKMTFQDENMLYNKILELISKIDPLNKSAIFLGVHINDILKGFIIKVPFGICVYGEDIDIESIQSNKTIKNPKFIYGIDYSDLEYLNDIYSTYKECTYSNITFKNPGSYIIIENDISTYYENFKEKIKIYKNGNNVSIRYNNETLNRDLSVKNIYERNEYHISLASGALNSKDFKIMLDFQIFIDTLNNIQTLNKDIIFTPYFSLLGKGYISKTPSKVSKSTLDGSMSLVNNRSENPYKFVVTEFKDENGDTSSIAISLITYSVVGSFIYNKKDTKYELSKLYISTDNYIL